MTQEISSPTREESLFYELFPSRVEIRREEQLEDVDKQLRKSGRFVALRGDGGGGKSYFLRHQLIPFYEGQANETNNEVEGEWRVAAFSPQINPIGGLALALSAPGILREQRFITPFFREELEAELRRGSDSLVDIYQDATEKGGAPFRLILVVDQLEDMFYMRDELHRKRSKEYEGLGKYYRPGDDILFFDLFLKALDSEMPIYVLFSIGSESIDRLNAYPEWPERISKHSYALPLIKKREVAQALWSRWPEDHSEVNSEAVFLANTIISEYGTISHNRRASAARVNVTLDILHRYGTDALVRVFNGLENPPDFITRVLESDKTSAAQASGLKRAFLDPKHRKTWFTWLAEGNNLQHKQEMEHIYFRELRSFYTVFGGLTGCANFYYNQVFSDLTEPQQYAVERLVKAISIKEVAPDTIADSYSVPFSVLVDLVFRKGDEYPEIVDILYHDALPPQFMPADANPAEKHAVVAGLIREFNFTGGTIPDLIRWIIPAGHIGSSAGVKFDDGTIIKLGTSALIQEWKLLKHWVDEEYEAAVIYQRLVEDSIAYYQDAVQKGSLSEGKVTDPKIPTLTDTFKETGATMWGQLKELIAQFGFLFFKKKEGVDIFTHKQTENINDLSEGRVEQAKEWFAEVLPSKSWAKKYRPEEIKAEDEAPSIAEGEGEPDEFDLWIEENELTAFSLTRKYWLSQYHRHEKIRRDKEAALLERINKERWVAKVLGGLTVVALLLAVYTGFSMKKAEDARNNYKLLDFVDNMTKVNLIPNSIYKRPEFQSLKNEIEKRDNITENSQVIDFLAQEEVLNFSNNSTDSRHGKVSKAALLHLDELVHNYKRDDALLVSGITDSILATAQKAIRINQVTTGMNYQYPYVYQVLYENYESLSVIASAREGKGERKVLEHAEVSNVDTAFARITAMVTNPRVVDQYAVGDEMGNVKIYTKGNKPFTRVKSLPYGISSMNYSRSGRELFATGYTGSIHRYAPLASENNRQSPRGYRDTLSPIELKVRWRSASSSGLPIISLHNTASSNLLLVRKDVGLYLIKKIGESTYKEVHHLNLQRDLRTLTAMAASDDGTAFMVGGAGRSALLGVDTEKESIQLVRLVDHRNISVSAIAFQPNTVSRDRALRVAVGTTAGDLWLTNTDAFKATGFAQHQLMDKLELRAKLKEKNNYQKSGITSLTFNDTGNDKTGNEQLIASSLDGTVYIFNFDVIKNDLNVFLERDSTSGIWDHLELISSGLSVDNVCLVNKDKIVVVENNMLRTWPTNLQTLYNKVDTLRNQLIIPQN